MPNRRTLALAAALLALFLAAPVTAGQQSTDPTGPTDPAGRAGQADRADRADRAAGQTFIDPTTGMEFVFVPGGTFTMGCGAWQLVCQGLTNPPHTVRIRGFWIGTRPVTQAQWRRVTGDNPSYFKKGGDFPVESVSFGDVRSFIDKLNVLGSEKFDLPTEAQWEYACRDGGRPEIYCGGDDVNALAWYAGNAEGATRPVGTRSPNALGLYDMSGDVWQWMRDAYDARAYEILAPDNPVNDPPAGRVHDGAHVLRGGSFGSVARYAQSSSRLKASADSRYIDTGLRLVRTEPDR